MFDQSLWEAEGWLSLLPFTDQPVSTIDGVDLLLNALPRPYPMEHVVSALGDAPGKEADHILADLIRRHPRLVSQHEWVRTLVEAACLTAKDELRDEYGSTEFEPRPPDVETGRPWPPAAGR